LRKVVKPMIPAWFVAVRGEVPRSAAILLGVVPVALMILLWWILTLGPAEERSIAPTILPSPGEVLQSVPELLTNRNLVLHIGASLQRVGFSYFLALAIVFPLGILMGAFGSASAAFTPIVTASGYVPIATLVPLTMSWFGTGELQKVIFLAMAFGIYLLPLVAKAIDGVPDVYLRTAFTLGASRWQIVSRVLVPVAMPDIWHSMRLAFGVGWTYLVLAEVVVLVDGLGYLIEISRRRGPREHIYLTIIVISLISWIADQAWGQLGSRLFPYRRSRA
jgi:ABC-type nitrate/sulfonate/bicarbonate transport system permease component